MVDLETLNNTPISRLVELAEADKDGRVVVLPCKGWLDIVFGEQTLFYGIDTGYIEEPIREISVDNAERISWYDGWKTVFLKGSDENGQEWEFLPNAIGKTVFLTREGAKKALRKIQGKENADGATDRRERGAAGEELGV